MKQSAKKVKPRPEPSPFPNTLQLGSSIHFRTLFTVSILPIQLLGMKSMLLEASRLGCRRIR